MYHWVPVVVTHGRCNNAKEMQRLSLDTWIIPCVLDLTLLHNMLLCQNVLHTTKVKAHVA